MRLLLALLVLLPSLASAQTVRVGVDGRGHGVHVQTDAAAVVVGDLDHRMKMELRNQAALIREIAELAPSAANAAVLRVLRDRIQALEDSRRILDSLRGQLVDFAAQGRVVEVIREVPVETRVEVIREVPAAPVEPQVFPVTPNELAGIKGAVQSESFRDGKMSVLRSASRGRWFLTGHVVELMGLFSFDDDKVEVAASLYNQTLDQENWYTVPSALTFSSSKDELRSRTGR
jgi:hypothetical protein